MSAPMRITWVLPFLQFTGGIRVVYEHSRELLARGHEVTLVVPKDGTGTPWTKRGRLAMRTWLVERFVLRPERMLEYYGLAGRVRRVPALDPAYLPPADVTLATSFHTTACVAERPASAGRGVNFLQHYEAFAPNPVEVVDAAWRMPLERIVIASWMVRFAAERFGLRAWGPVVNGVDLAQFHARGRGENDPPVVGMLYETAEWKGCDDGFAAIAEARRQVPGLGLRLFGRLRLRRALGAGDRYLRNPSPARLSALYRECDFFLSPSWAEGCQLPPMEAMASGCAVVATEVGGVPDYAIPGTTALTAPPRQPAALAAHLVHLARDRAFARDVARRGREHIAQFTWPVATDRLESILSRILAGETA